MSTAPTNKNTSPFCVVVGLKLTDAGTHAFEQATRIAQRIPGCALHLLHVAEDAPSEAKTRELVGRLRLYANEKTKSLGALPLVTLGIHVRSGDPAEEMARFAAEVSADMIVLGPSKTHLKNLYTAPTVERLIALTSCPVVVAGPRPHARDSHVLVIESACPDCVRARAASKSAKWWCARHSEHAKRAHTFSYQRELPLSTHDSQVIPTGVDID